MRLINTTTLELRSSFSRSIPRYATLSHCWGEEEVSLQDFATNVKHKAGYKKILHVCRLAKEEYDLDWVWVDTCCIDKTSSAELSESINSMFRWYQESFVCYALLEDVSMEDGEGMRDFAKSRWFTRGWTLQELLAPSSVRFFDNKMRFIGTRKDHAQLISSITQIPATLLDDPQRNRFRKTSIACRMSWASRRQTTREEDMAYCLLGIFEVNMPLLYGEGKKAFHRLQEYIINSSTDDSIFAWTLDPESERSEKGGLLASSTRDFARSSTIVAVNSTTRPPAIVTNNGIQIHHALTDPLDMGRHALYWFIGNNASSMPIYFDLNCVHETKEQPPKWISIPLKNEVTSNGFYHREDRNSLMQRRVNLSLIPRFYTKLYVTPHGSSPQDKSQLDMILDKYRHHRWLRYIHVGLLLRVPLDSLALCLFCVFSQAAKLSTMARPTFYFVVVVIHLVFLDEVALIIPGKQNRTWLKCFFWLFVCLTASVPVQLVGAFTLASDVVDLLVPYGPFRPSSVSSGVVSEGLEGN